MESAAITWASAVSPSWTRTIPAGGCHFARGCAPRCALERKSTTTIEGVDWRGVARGGARQQFAGAFERVLAMRAGALPLLAVSSTRQPRSWVRRSHGPRRATWRVTRWGDRYLELLENTPLHPTSAGTCRAPARFREGSSGRPVRHSSSSQHQRTPSDAAS